jgi:hypothetical protein
VLMQVCFKNCGAQAIFLMKKGTALLHHQTVIGKKLCLKFQKKYQKNFN